MELPSMIIIITLESSQCENALDEIILLYLLYTSLLSSQS